ncbi:MAG: hypothetical protein H7Y09_12955 [Chitinophagaceae bacterium]|nr:hypothetical protein [Anaerolineae bacterium]
MRKRNKFELYDAPRKRKNDVETGTQVSVKRTNWASKTLRIGAGLWFFALVMLFFFVFIPNSLKQNGVVAALRNSLFCGTRDEIFIEDTSQTNIDDDMRMTSYLAFCVNGENQRRDVTLRTMLFALASIGLPCALGILPLLMGGVGLVISSAQNRSTQFMQNSVEDFVTSTLPVTTTEDNRVFWDGKEVTATEAEYLIEHTMQQADLKVPIDESLDTRLQKLKTSLDAGWINQEEYDRLRQQVEDTGHK